MSLIKAQLNRVTKISKKEKIKLKEDLINPPFCIMELLECYLPTLHHMEILVSSR